ncbi:PD-(D/E)XK motif protein [Cereibacter azotoformans]|uniref:PD-(D/E)XK motif protein n=1 Tax=Cereibacter azotoformans TaxID=43057 RepID=UPI001EEB29C9|nr:PD-(D/E)XK motif protein [Cereibacter azotoformans]ULB09176.1 PD-(D/E)XK motif protein [Cereibacter azotoformans]
MTWTEEGLVRTWRALKDVEGEEWALSPLYKSGNVVFHAGRSFPGSREAIVVDFPAGTIKPADRLPGGGGFDVLRVPSRSGSQGREAIALVRLIDGSHELFALMAVNVLRHLEYLGCLTPRAILDAFFVRVREWQEFMANQRRKPLSTEKQAGLMGELLMIEELVGHAGSALVVLDSWQGPLRAAQDFHVESGAIEVKSTAAAQGFIARINSVEQLDADRSPMFLCAIRFAENEAGETLTQCVNRLREIMDRSGVRKQFDALLMLSRFMDEHADRYTRKLLAGEMLCFRVENGFPCLRRDTLPGQIRNAQYDLDIESLDIEPQSTDMMFQQLGETADEPA